MSDTLQIVIISLLTITSAVSILNIITINQTKLYIKRISCVLKDLTGILKISGQKADIYQSKSIDYSCQSCLHRKTYLHIENGETNTEEAEFYSFCELKKKQVLLNHSCIHYKSE